MLLSNWDASAISNAIVAASGEAQNALQQLQDAAFIEIVLNGHSNVDFSQARGELITVESLGWDAAQALAATGQFTIEYLPTAAEAMIFDPVFDELGNIVGGSFRRVTAQAQTAVIKPAASNPLKTGGSGRKYSGGGSGGKSGGGGGGGGAGGGSSKINVSKKTQNLLDEIDATKELYDYRLKLIQLAKDYYEATGQTQGVIEYTEQEIAVRHEQSDAMEKYIEQ